MSRLIMGPRRMSEALASCGLQKSDKLEKNPRKRSEMWNALWNALERACDERFPVELPPPCDRTDCIPFGSQDLCSYPSPPEKPTNTEG